MCIALNYSTESDMKYNDHIPYAFTSYIVVVNSHFIIEKCKVGKMNTMCYRSQCIRLMLLTSLLPLIQGTHRVPPSIDPQLILEWTQVEYKYPSDEDRQKDIESKNFIPGTPVIIDVDVVNTGNDKRNTYFVTTPRFQAGVPATLSKVTLGKIGSNHLIEPYPSWKWHKNPRKCSTDRLISVFRVQIDTCGRLWVLDNGNYEDKLICSPQIIAFNLKTNEVVHRYEIPLDQLQSNSLLVTPVVDITDGCSNAFVYAADCQGNAIIVHDVANNSSWKIQDKTMYPDPDFGTYTILGESFDLMDGILGMALGTGPDPKLFFHAMSSNTEHAVKTLDLRNASNFKDSPNSSPGIFHTYRGRRKSQSPAEAIDKNGILYFGDVNEVTLNCWDTSTEYGSRHIRVLSCNQTILQFTSGVKVIDNPRGGQDLFVVTSRFQKVALGTMNSNEVNFRILKLQLNHITKHKCS